jgi:hypothetical protein
MFVSVCVSAPRFLGRYCIHFEVTGLLQVESELILRRKMYWLSGMVCGRLACHSYETGKTRRP